VAFLCVQDISLGCKYDVAYPADYRQRALQATAGKGAYAQVGFAYEADAADENDSDDDEEEEEEEVSSSEDSEDEEIERIGRAHGVQRFNWQVHLDRKAKEEERRQKEAAKGDPAMVSNCFDLTFCGVAS
jgi:hypothetical protein